jgi:hypothetical protein
MKVELKRKYGDYAVPVNYERDTHTWQWAAKQRHFHNNNKIRLDRKGLLDKIGFVWNVEDHAATQLGSLTNNKLREDRNALLDSEAFASSVGLSNEAIQETGGLPNEAIEETEPAQDLSLESDLNVRPSPTESD